MVEYMANGLSNMIWLERKGCEGDRQWCMAAIYNPIITALTTVSLHR